MSFQAYELTKGHKISANCKEVDSLIVDSIFEDFRVYY